MTTTKAYLAALKKNVSQDKLEAMERTLISETSLSHLTELLRQEVVKLTGKRNRLPQLTLVRVRLASLLEQMALGNDTMAGFNAAVQACDLWDHDLNNAGGARKMRLRALWLAGTAFPEYLEQAVNVANGPEATIHLLKDEIKKTNDLEEGNQRLTLTAIMMEVLKTFGKPKKAFFEAMKSVRKWPQNYFLHRQLRKYAELTQKGEEALFTLQDLLSRERKAERSTALIQESLGRVYHLMLDDDKAFKAYCSALNEDSDSYDAWHYGKKLAEKHGHHFEYQQPKEKTIQDGITIAEPNHDSHQPTLESKPPPASQTAPSQPSRASIQSLDDDAILAMHTYSSEGPPLLPDDSEDNPPSLPPPDRHDDYDHIFAGQRQQMAMDSDMVSEARPISDDSDIDRTIVSAMPSLDASSIDSDFSEPTLVEAIDGSSSSTTVGFRRGNIITPPKDENTSKSLVSDLDTSSSEALSESDLLEGPSVERLEQAFQSNDNKVACSILATYDPIYISSKWRARLLEKVLKHTEEDNDLVSMKAHFETILEEGTDGRFELLAHFFSALPHQQKSALSSLWSKALEYIPEDRAPSDDIYELLLLGTCTQPHLSTKMFQLIGHCDDTNKKVELYRKLLPVWTEVNGRQMIYTTLVQLLSEPKQILALSQDWIKDIPEAPEAYENLTQSAIALGDFHLAKEGFEEQLQRAETGKDKAALWRALGAHYLSTSHDYWKEAANACVQAIGFEPQDIAHWSELIYVVGRNFKPQQRQNARALIEDPNEWVISEIRNFIDPILFDLAESDQVLPNPVKRLLGLLLSVAPKQPQIALNYLENLLEHFPADLLLLEAYAHLLASHGMKAAHSQNDKLNPLENILSAHAEAIDVMKQISLWGDLGTVRWAAGDYTGAMTAIENLFQLLPKENDDAAMSDQILDTALSVLDAPENKQKNQQLLIKTLELKADRQNQLERLKSLKRALTLASKHNPAKAKKILSKFDVSDIDIGIIESGKKAYDNLDLLEEFCQQLRDWLKDERFSNTVKQAALEILAEVEGQLLRRPEGAAEALIELANYEQGGGARHAQAANLLLEVGDVTKAIQALRQSVIKDLEDPQSWQTLFECAQKIEDPDLMFFAGQTMKALNYASAELLDALESLPHHNPTCLEYKQTLPNLIQLLKHPFEKGVHAEIIAMLSECTVQLFGKALSAVGLMERQQLRPDLLAPQWQTGLNHLYQLLGFNMHLPIYGNHRHMPTSAVLAPTAPPALVVHSEVSLPEKNFSHQDAFWVARALYWALPQNQPISIMNPEELRGVFTALRAHLLQQVHPKTAQSAIQSGRAICGAYIKSLPSNNKTQAIANLASQLKSHAPSLDHQLLQRLQQGVSLTSNRLGLLMCGDIERTLQCIDQLHHNASDKSRTVAYRDVLGCAISDAFLSIRKELGWNLPMSSADALKNVKASI